MRPPAQPFVALAALGLAMSARPQTAAADPAAAGVAALRAAADRLLASHDGDLARAVDDLWAAAIAEAERPQSAELLRREALALAERHGDARLAWTALDLLASTRALDLAAERQALARRLAARADLRTNLTLAQLVLAASRQALHTEDPKPACDLLPMAMHVVARDDGALAAFVRAACDEIAGWRHLRTETSSAFWRQQPADVFERLATGGDCRNLGLDWLVPCGAELTEAERQGHVGQLASARLQALATPSLPTALRHALLRQAQAAAVREFAAATTDTSRRQLAREIAQRTNMLAPHAGTTLLQFASAGDLAPLRLGNGDWRVQDGRLLGDCRGTENFATHRLAFTGVRSVRILGGIRSSDGQNFRCKVGDANLLLNWEVRDENHLWHHGRCEAKGPPALRVGVEHSILLFAGDGRVHVCIDDQPWWSFDGSLDGTITVYPALGSAIFVREIRIDGQPDTFVDGPRGELK